MVVRATKSRSIDLQTRRIWRRGMLRIISLLLVGGIYCWRTINGYIMLVDHPAATHHYVLKMEEFMLSFPCNETKIETISPQVKRTVDIEISNVLWSRNWHNLATCDSVPSNYYTLEGVRAWCSNRWTTECVHSPEQMKTFFGNCSTEKTQQHTFWVRLQSTPDGDIATFADVVLPLLQHPFELITSDGDNSVPSKIPNAARKILASPLLLAWLTQNYDGSLSHPKLHPKLHPIPIGLDLHTRYGGLWATESLLENLAEMKKLRKAGKTSNRSSDFWIPPWSSSNVERSRSIQAVRHCLQPKPFQSRKLPIKELWKKYTEYRFGLSPPGNGLDCHRTWEMLFFGMIPIVKKSALDPLYKGLPVLVVEDWSELCNPGFLQDSYANLSRLLPADDSIVTMQYYKRNVVV